MTVVLDASAAIAVVLGTPQAEQFIPQLEQADVVMAPDIFIAEVCNALWKYRRADMLSQEHGERAVEQVTSLPDQLIPSKSLYQEAFTLATRHQHPVYDTLYLTLARRNNATLLTLDRRLIQLANELEIKTNNP